MVVKPVNDFNATQSHLEALNHRLVELLGDDYAIQDEPADFEFEDEPFIRYPIRCIYYTHGDDCYDEDPSGWIAVSQKDGHLISGCWVCNRPQVIKHQGEYQPAPTLLTLSRNDKRLLKTLLDFGCEEVTEVNGNEQIAVAFPVTYADGSEGFHYRVALEGRDKWLHQKGGKASQAVFGLHKTEIQAVIREAGYVVITESPPDAAVLITARFPSISGCGKGNTPKALACDQHKETLLGLLGDSGVIYVWDEPDAPEFAQKVANALQRPVKVIYPPDYAKDAYRLWLACGKEWDRFRGEIVGLTQKATEIAPQPEPKIVKVKQRFEEAVWRPLGEITMPQNDRWQVEGLIKEGNLVILSARPKTSKSIVALNLAACVAMGKSFLDRSVTQGRALFVAYERHKVTLERALAMGLAKYEDFMLWDKVAYGLPRVDCLDGWLNFMERYSVKLVVFDTLAHFLKPELEKVRNGINAYDHIYKIMETLQSAAEETGRTIVLIHHDRKGETAETDEARVLGTTALTASVDVVLQLKPMSDNVICLKASGNAIEDTALYFRVGQDFWIELADKPATTKEEKAAKAIEDYLRQHGEATRQQLIDLMLQIELSENKTAASKLVDRVIQDRLLTKIRKEVKGGMSVYYWQGGRVTSPANKPDALGGLKTTTRDIEFVSGVSNQGATRDIRDIRDNGRNVSIVSYSQPDLQRETPKTNPIDVSNPDSPEGDLQATVEVWDYGRVFGDLTDDDGNPQPDRPAGSPPAMPDPQPADPLWLVFDGVLPELVVDQPRPDSPMPEVSPPDQPVATLNEPVCPICRIELEPEPDSGLAACLGCGRLFKVEIPPTSPDDDNPHESPDGDNGQGGGHGGFAPPEPVKEPTGSPPNLTKDNNGRRVTGSPTLSDPQSYWVKLPCAQAKSEVSPPDSPTPNNGQTQITVRLPDGSIKLASWLDKKKKKTKTKIVTPADLVDWQPIEEIPDIDLPNIETVKIPPVVVLDLETTDLDPQQGRILACGLALYVAGKEVETLIIDSDDGEANLLAQTFDWLRETCDGLGEIILTGYNVFDFDLTYLIERARRLKVECPFRFLKDKNSNIVRWKVAATEGTLKRDPLDYNAILVDRSLPIRIVDTLHLVCRWDYTAKQLIHYDLKSVAEHEHFGVNIPDRPVLTHKQIVHAYYHDRPKFNAYLLADLRETYALFAKLIPPYVGVAALTELPLEKVAVKSTAWFWEQILERYYTQIPQADEKRDYEGGLVVSRKGLWSPCLKIDIASLYPTIMLAYRIHSRKDTDQIALRWLKTLTRQRLELKAKAKAGDANAQILQEAMKILLNSLYGFYGTGGYPFNDMNAAEKVTEIGRKVLICMIAAIEDKGGIIVEADTDGLIVCYRNADPQEILEAVNAAIPEVFKVELEWQDRIVFVSDDKNYVVLDANGDIETVKGSKWRGRDKSAYARKAIPTFLQRWVTKGKEAALEYARQVLSEIRSGNGWDWVVCTQRVGRGDKTLLLAGFEEGEKATFAYKRKTSKPETTEIAKSPEEGYDCDYYAKQFSKTLKEVIEVIDPAQIEAWERMVAAEARPLIFATN